MARVEKTVRILVGGLPVTTLANNDPWVTDPVPANGAIAFLAMFSSLTGATGATTVVAQGSVDKGFTVPVTLVATSGVSASSTPGSPAFLIGGQANTWQAAGSGPIVGCPWPWFRLSGTVGAAGTCTGASILLTVVYDINR